MEGQQQDILRRLNRATGGKNISIAEWQLAGAGGGGGGGGGGGRKLLQVS